MPADAFPRRFGPYTLLGELGRGGMGEVYVAGKLGPEGVAKRLVVKTARRDVAEAAGNERRFLDELRVTVHLDHRNICSVIDVGKVGDTPYLALEYISRLTLRDVQNRARELQVPIPEEVALYIARGVLAGLEHAHTRRDPGTGEWLGIVHRDVSPQNVMLRHDGDVKLIDFGLAQARGKTEQTETGTVVGKVPYMAPEQVRDEIIDARADQFAAAVVLYELVVGERFYEGMSPHQTWGPAGAGGFLPPRWDAVRPELQEILSVALAKDRQDRFASCEAFSAALSFYSKAPIDARGFQRFMKELFPDGEAEEHAFLQHLPAALRASELSAAEAAFVERAPKPEESGTSLVPRRGKPARSGRRWRIAAAALLGIVAVGGAVVALSPGERTTASAPPVEVVAPVAEAVKEVAPPTIAPIEEPAVEEEEVEPPKVAAVAPTKAPERAAPVVKQPREKKPEPVKAPRTSTEVERALAAFRGCENFCASFYGPKMSGHDEIPGEIRFGVLDCVERCKLEKK